MKAPAGAPGFVRPGAGDLERAYREGGTSPVEVASACLQAIRAADRDQPPLRAIITLLDDGAHAAAEASTQRWRDGRPLSPLDGVPVVVKDNIDVAGVRTTNGTVLDFPIPARDAEVVARLCAAGAIVVGKANLHEIGAGTTGINPHYGTPRNPFDDGRWCGGSSSGSACAVGAGIVPIAIGTDAGGSVRAPAAFVGAVGLKPTFGRVSRLGMSVLCDTIDHIGPIATSCADAAAALAAMAGAHPDDEETWDQPPFPHYDQVAAEIGRSIAGVTVGVARALFDHHTVDPAVAAEAIRAADALEDAGARLVDVEVPDLDESRLVGLLLLGAEGPSGLEQFLTANQSKLGADLQVLLAFGAHVAARDYLKAQRVRHQIRREWGEVLSRCDLVLAPAAGIPAGVIHEDALATGEIDETTSSKAISNTFPSNLTGFPALTVPCGFVGALPVSAQLVARPWEELLLLRGGAALERAKLFAPRRPPRWYGDGIYPLI